MSDLLDYTVTVGLRLLPAWRGKTNVALGLKRARERQGSLEGTWCLRLSTGFTACLPRGSQMTWAVAATGSWDRHVIELLSRYIEPGTVALDIGASLGLWSLPLGRVVRSNSGRLWCFEPNPANIPLLHANLERNGLASVAEVKPVALGSRRGTVRLGHRESGGGNAAVLALDAGDFVEVPVVPLDDFDFPHRVSFIKMDVEGFELEVLRGGRQLIARDQPMVYGEFNATWLRRREADLAAALSSFAALGYHVFAVREWRSAVWRSKDEATLRQIESPFTRAGENLLLVPASWRDVIERDQEGTDKRWAP